MAGESAKNGKLLADGEFGGANASARVGSPKARSASPTVRSLKPRK